MLGIQSKRSKQKFSIWIECLVPDLADLAILLLRPEARNRAAIVQVKEQPVGLACRLVYCLISW